MELSSETLDLVISVGATIAALGATYALKKLRQTMREKVVSEEQADMILDELEGILPEKHLPRFRKLRESWDDEEVTTEDLKEIIAKLR